MKSRTYWTNARSTVRRTGGRSGDARQRLLRARALRAPLQGFPGYRMVPQISDAVQGGLLPATISSAAHLPHEPLSVRARLIL
jgi:hypothetical protein